MKEILIKLTRDNFNFRFKQYEGMYFHCSINDDSEVIRYKITKDKEGLDSLVNQVEQGGFGIDYYYPTILSRATYYWYTIATKQMFFNGNKRTALITALTYLENNGYQFEIYDNKELYNVSLKLARKEISKDMLFQYIQAHTILNFEWMESALCVKGNGQR